MIKMREWAQQLTQKEFYRLVQNDIVDDFRSTPISIEHAFDLYQAHYKAKDGAWLPHFFIKDKRSDDCLNYHYYEISVHLAYNILYEYYVAQDEEPLKKAMLADRVFKILDSVHGEEKTPVSFYKHEVKELYTLV